MKIRLSCGLLLFFHLSVGQAHAEETSLRENLLEAIEECEDPNNELRHRSRTQVRNLAREAAMDSSYVAVIDLLEGRAADCLSNEGYEPVVFNPATGHFNYAETVAQRQSALLKSCLNPVSEWLEHYTSAGSAVLNRKNEAIILSNTHDACTQLFESHPTQVALMAECTEAFLKLGHPDLDEGNVLALMSQYEAALDRINEELAALDEEPQLIVDNPRDAINVAGLSASEARFCKDRLDELLGF